MPDPDSAGSPGPTRGPACAPVGLAPGTQGPGLQLHLSPPPSEPRRVRPHLQRQFWTCWTQHPAGAGTFHAGDAERTSWTPPTSCTATPSRLRNLGYSHTRSLACAPTRGNLPVGGEHPRWWGGFTPATPLLSVRGCKWGPNPLGSIDQTLKGTCEECVSSYPEHLWRHPRDVAWAQCRSSLMVEYTNPDFCV